MRCTTGWRGWCGTTPCRFCLSGWAAGTGTCSSTNSRTPLSRNGKTSFLWSTTSLPSATEPLWLATANKRFTAGGTAITVSCFICLTSLTTTKARLQTPRPPFNEALDDQVLKDNWRSGNKIVDWNNGFFDAVQSRLPAGLQAVYKDHRQDARRHLKVKCASKPFTKQTKTRAKELLSDALIRRLRHHKSAEGGGFAWADMAVLVRTNKQGALLAQAHAQ